MTRHSLTRRAALGALAGALAAPAVLRAQTAPRVVVVGGGAGGATCARYLAKDAQGAIDVTLVEANPVYATCFFSNLMLGGFRTPESIRHGYDRLTGNYGVKLVTARAEAVDRDAHAVVLADGTRLAYDRLVLSPGIDMVWDSVPGWGEDAVDRMPHAYKGGPAVEDLKKRVEALADGENIVMIAPPNPYRCPPGPYERVSMFAHLLKSSGKTASKIFVLDAKDKFSKQALFVEGWQTHYPGMIEWLAPDMHGGVVRVDPAAGTVETDLDTFEGALVNVIPAQRAGAIARAAGLTNDGGFCPIDPASMRAAGDPNVWVLGDACIAGDMPKSAFSANSQAKVAAMTIRADLTGSRAFPARYANTCWSLLAPDDCVKVGGQYGPTPEKIAADSTFVSQTGEEAAIRRANAEEAVGWYAGITADMFG